MTPKEIAIEEIKHLMRTHGIDVVDARDKKDGGYEIGNPKGPVDFTMGKVAGGDEPKSDYKFLGTVGIGPTIWVGGAGSSNDIASCHPGDCGTYGKVKKPSILKKLLSYLEK